MSRVKKINDPQCKHILIVDDEPNVRAPLAHALSLEGYRIREASSGQEALRRLEQASYDLMILDMYMPGIGGVEVMQQARQRYPTLPIIILTGKATLESAITAVKVHAADYLLKPVGMRKLVATVREVLERQATDKRQQELLQLIGHAFDELRGHSPPPAS
jgi:two-component system nitrogen regulation response regulator NtrX